jgi:hypothetical protein
MVLTILLRITLSRKGAIQRKRESVAHGTQWLGARKSLHASGIKS